MKVDVDALVEKLKILARTHDRQAVREELADTHVADLAQGFERLPFDEGQALLAHLDAETASELLAELPGESGRPYLEDLPDGTLAHFLDILPMDDAAELRDVIGEERFDALLNIIPDEDAREIRRLLAYPEDSVGRIMTEAFFEVAPEATMAELLEDIRRSKPEKYEMVNDIYVLDEDRHLLGIFSLRKAVRGGPEMTARDMMNSEVISCRAEEPAEDAARKMARYGFYALPVLDSRAKMVGLFTGDDAQFIIREADTEDVLMLGAVSGGAESYLSLSVLQLFRRRIVWLLLLFVAETATGMVMRHYGQGSGSGLSLNPLTFFIPLIIGAGGNSGAQVTTTLTRALAVGEVQPSDALRILQREFLVALLIGGVLGATGYLRAQFWNSPPEISYVVGLSLPAIVLWATAVGSLLPLAAKRMGFDPAVMSAPFITTFVDATGLVIYFEIARRLL